MIRFQALLDAGVAVAAMSGVEDGDCGTRAMAAETRAAFCRRAGVDPARVLSVIQVHGNRVVLADEATAGSGRTEADGLVTNVPGLPLSISIADCVPVLLYCRNPSVIGILHSGRASTFGNIAEVGVSLMGSRFGCSPSDILAVVGPCITEAHYEVSEAIAEEFRNAGYAVRGRQLDLPGIIAQQLHACGLPAQHITFPSACTYEDRRFYSYRRGDLKERNTALLML